jgi:Spy/CpxP family protein refolding chaperone
MKVRTGLITAVLLMASAATWAQAPAPGHHGRMDMDRLEVLLELDAYQKQEVQKIFDARREARREKRSQLRDAGKRPSPDEMKAQREAERQQTREQLAKVLSEEQLKKLDALMEFDRPHPPRRRVR